MLMLLVFILSCAAAIFLIIEVVVRAHSGREFSEPLVLCIDFIMLAVITGLFHWPELLDLL